MVRDILHVVVKGKMVVEEKVIERWRKCGE
jgi:hypothetical protein